MLLLKSGLGEASILALASKYHATSTLTGDFLNFSSHEVVFIYNVCYQLGPVELGIITFFVKFIIIILFFIFVQDLLESWAMHGWL